jgi:hypothetical protein
LPKYAKLRKLQKIRVLSRKLFKGGSTNPPKKCFFGIAGKKCVSRKKRITSIWAWTAYKRKKHAFWHVFSHYSPLETGTGHMASPAYNCPFFDRKYAKNARFGHSEGETWVRAWLKNEKKSLSTDLSKELLFVRIW